MDLLSVKEKFPEMEMKVNEPLFNYTYTRTGGPADLVVWPHTQQQVRDLIEYLNNEDIPYLVLGNSSNVIIRDGGIRGVAIILTELRQICLEGSTKIVAEAGARLIDVAYAALFISLTGLEFASGIPGSIGGAVYMNAGAYGGEVSEVIESVDVVTTEGKIKTLSNKQLNFSYRHSLIQETKDVVLSVTFNLSKGNYREIDEKIIELTELRQSKQPLEYPSCGSVFKRPPGHFAGKLIQDAGLQGKKIGGAQVSEKHAGFIVNIDHATASNYLDLIHLIQKEVKEQFGVDMYPEVQVLGEEPHH